MNSKHIFFVSDDETKIGISNDPVNILFNPASISKKDVWEIDIIRILKILIKILEKSDKKDLRIAGMAALSSSLIYRMKVESIFALQKAAMEKTPLTRRTDVNIDLIEMPYRNESTYPVSLDELLGLLENLIGSIANPRSRRSTFDIDPMEPPNFKDYFVSFENMVGKYEELIMKKISSVGHGLLQTIVADLDVIDAVRCFFTILFLARDEKIDIEQVGDDIKITIKQKGATDNNRTKDLVN